MIKNFPFYPYYSKQAQSVLSDILDGYFPYDLKKKYPEGVPLKPVDMVDETFTEKTLQNPKFKELADLDGLKPKSKKEFLNQFPKSVMKNGKQVPIREELEKKFQETQEIDVNKLNTNEPIEIKSHVKPDTPASEIVNLRIRSETGKRVLLLKVLATDKMEVVYKLVKPYTEEKGIQFELRTNFPNRAYEQKEDQSLKDLGLAPSSAMIVRKM